MTKDALQGFPSDTSSSTSLIIALELLVLWKSAIKFVSHARPCCRNTVLASLWWTHSCGEAELHKQERWKRLNPRDWLYSHLMAPQSPKTRQETSFLWLSVTKTKRSRWENGRLNEDKQRHKVCESEAAGSWRRAAEDEWDALLMAKSQTSSRHVLYCSNFHKHKKKKILISDGFDFASGFRNFQFASQTHKRTSSQ